MNLSNFFHRLWSSPPEHTPVASAPVEELMPPPPEPLAKSRAIQPWFIQDLPRILYGRSHKYQLLLYPRREDWTSPFVSFDTLFTQGKGEVERIRNEVIRRVSSSPMNAVTVEWFFDEDRNGGNWIVRYKKGRPARV